jgi:hypothetical protein
MGLAPDQPYPPFQMIVVAELDLCSCCALFSLCGRGGESCSPSNQLNSPQCSATSSGSMPSSHSHPNQKIAMHK